MKMAASGDDNLFPQDGFCTVNESICGASLTQWYNTPSKNVTALVIAILEKGPISVAIDASHRSFGFYSYGVYYEPECGKWGLWRLFNAHVHAHKHTHTHSYALMHTHAYSLTCMLMHTTHTHTLMHTLMHTHIHTYVHTHTHTHTHAHKHTHTYYATHTHMCAHAHHTHTRTHKHTHTHRQR